LPCCTFFAAKIPIAKLSTKEKVSAEKNLHEIDTSNLPIQKINEVWNGNLIESLREMHKKGEWFKNDVCKECVMSSANIDDDV
jgi:hypothetical protein